MRIKKLITFSLLLSITTFLPSYQIGIDLWTLDVDGIKEKPHVAM
jgi:hypothetical protein